MIKWISMKYEWRHYISPECRPFVRVSVHYYKDIAVASLQRVVLPHLPDIDSVIPGFHFLLKTVEAIQHFA